MKKRIKILSELISEVEIRLSNYKLIKIQQEENENNRFSKCRELNYIDGAIDVCEDMLVMLKSTLAREEDTIEHDVQKCRRFVLDGGH